MAGSVPAGLDAGEAFGIGASHCQFVTRFCELVRGFGRWDGRLACSRLVGILAMGMASLLLANCSSPGVSRAARVKDPRYGVYASPRLVEGAGPIDPSVSRRGIYVVGKPYTVAGRQYVPREDRRYTAVGMASWYGNAFHGRLTANGEIFDMHDISAAHPTMPLPSYARVTNLANGNSIVVRVNDRGPYHGNRVIDVSSRAAELLAFKRSGTGRVRVDYVGPAQRTGSDETMLLATLRTDGSAAPAPVGSPDKVMIAEGPAVAPQRLGIDEATGALPASAAAFTAVPPARPAELEQPAEASDGLSAPDAVPAVSSPVEQEPADQPERIPLPPPRTAGLATGSLAVVDVAARHRVITAGASGG
jgi:rare lipoprotein A